MNKKVRHPFRAPAARMDQRRRHQVRAGDERAGRDAQASDERGDRGDGEDIGEGGEAEIPWRNKKMASR